MKALPSSPSEHTTLSFGSPRSCPGPVGGATSAFADRDGPSAHRKPPSSLKKENSPIPPRSCVDDLRIGPVDVSPALARHWLTEHNTHNRSLRPRVVAAYARDMHAGRWMDNGETIKFAADGTLLDG
ncbi:hypothetical protein QQY66_00225 [Streptomyces sp. DG2A-72]|uniref:hypothetical protein n=1 Tax=Streptomyces sp. DG2A-72 TaxID=3051386 RepID=UPI00265BC455|nr:hypothetical protein [Streptomyces sp. DG2A-72]MDO0930218.1 hypothetical protein [Streptomyces sp. DG2A-72]